MSLVQILLVAGGVYVVMSLITMGVYARDKLAAQRGRMRVRERTLHVLELAGGWPGGLAAQRVLRHKRRKIAFVLITWLIGIAHVIGWFEAWRHGWLG